MKKETLYAVLGLGVFGQELCKVLSERGARVIAVDYDWKLVDRVKDIVTEAVLLDSSNEEALRNAGLQDVDLAIVAMGNNIEGSILTTVLLTNIGVPRIIARAVSDVHAQVLQQVGATEIINIAVAQGKRLAQRILAPDLMEIIPVSGDHSIAEIRIPSEFVDKSLRDIDLRNKHQVTLVSVKRIDMDIDEMGNPKRKEEIICLKPDESLKINDIMVVLGKEKDIQNLRETQ